MKKILGIPLLLCAAWLIGQDDRALLEKTKLAVFDKEWQAAEDEIPIMREVLSNQCAEELKRIARASQAIGESFVMDNQGALVGSNNLTSDYWQGDEAKWQNSYNRAKGGIDIGEPKFDKSSNKVLRQVSLPVVDSAGTIIGAVTYGTSAD